MARFINPCDYTGAKGTKTQTGQVRFANTVEAAAGERDDLSISPATLASAVGDLVPSATTVIEGVVLITDNSSPVATKAYADALAIAGSPVSTETTAGIGQLATDAEAVAGTPSTGLLALFVTPSNLASVFAAAPAIGGTTPAAAVFTDLTASGAISLDTTVATHYKVTGAADMTLESTLGGVDLVSGLAAADAITLQAASGGLDVDTALLLSLRSSRNNASAIEIVATAGGVDISAVGTAGEDIDILATGSSVNITATENVADSIVISSSNGGIDIIAASASAGEDIDITASGSSVNITATENNAGAIIVRANGGTSERVTLLSSQGTGSDSVNLESTAGGITLSGALATADAINFVTSNAAGGIDIDSGTGGIAADSTGSIVVTSTANSAASIFLHANGGTSETIRLHADQGTGVASLDLLSDVGGVTLRGGVASADAINITATNAAGGVDIDSGTGGVIVDSTGTFSIDGAATSNVTVTGAGADLNLTSSLGSVLVEATEDAALAIRLHANGGTSETIQIHSDQGTGVSSVGLLSDVGGITLRATGLASADAINLESVAGGLDIDAALQINITSSQDASDAIRILASAGGLDIDAVGSAGEDINITNTGGSVVIVATESAADSIKIESTLGGVQILASGAAAAEDIVLTATGSSIRLTATESATDSINIESTLGGVNILASGAAAGEDINVIATGSSINLTATEAAANAIVLSASNAAGGIDLTTGGGSVDVSSAGFFTVVSGTNTAAGDTIVLNTNVGNCVYTGFTTAAAASQVFNVTNSLVAATSAVLVTVNTLGANDAQMTIQRVKCGSGTFAVTCKNNGAAAVNGDIHVNFWVYDV